MSDQSQDAATAEIYGLYDPQTFELRYIGKANNSVARLKSHILDCRRRNAPVHCWIRKLIANGRYPTIRVIEIVPYSDWQIAEKMLIRVHRLAGSRLLNIADGGDQPACSAEVRAVNGRRVASLVHSDAGRRRIWELKRAIGQSLRDGYIADRTRVKLRLAAAKYPRLFGEYANT